MVNKINFNYLRNEPDAGYGTIIDFVGKTGQVLGKIHFCQQAETAILVSRIDNYSKKTKRAIPGIGFHLMKMAIKSSLSCRTRLTAVQDSVFFYWKLGFRVMDESINFALAQEFQNAKEGKRDPVASEGEFMYLPFKARRIWQSFLYFDAAVLQKQLQGNPFLIQNIAKYINFEDEVPQLTSHAQQPLKQEDYLFKARNGKDVVLTYTENSQEGTLHDRNFKFAVVNCDQDKRAIESLTNHTKGVHFEHNVTGLCFFLMKRMIAANQCVISTTLDLDTCKHLFFYYKLGFELDPNTPKFAQGKVEIRKLLREFAQAAKKDSKPKCHYGHLAKSLNYKIPLVLRERGVRSWEMILASESSLQEHLNRTQNVIELIQQYLLPRIRY